MKELDDLIELGIDMNHRLLVRNLSSECHFYGLDYTSISLNLDDTQEASDPFLVTVSCHTNREKKKKKEKDSNSFNQLCTCFYYSPEEEHDSDHPFFIVVNETSIRLLGSVRIIQIIQSERAMPVSQTANFPP